MSSVREDLPTTITRLRELVDSGATRDLTWRLDQLAALDSLLRDNSAVLARALATDLGKSPSEAHLTEIGVVRAEIRHIQRHLERWITPRRVRMPLLHRPARGEVMLEPLGVILIMAPWNYPVQLLLSPLAGALAAGNTAVLKPSELTPTVSRLIATLVPRYLDTAIVVEGGVEETTSLLRHRFDHIVFTGSGRVGRIVMRAAAEHLTPVTLELGGKSPTWVDDSSDLAAAARRIVWTKFINTGQTCVAPDYLLTTPDVARRLEPLLAAAIRDMFGDDPRRSKDLGRMVSESHAERVVSLLDRTVTNGARIVIGGERDVTDRFIAPTVVGDVTVDSALMSEEIFGPVLPIVAVSDLDAAIGVIRDRDKPLALYAFTENADVRERLRGETSSGALAFDAPLIHASVPTLPFGGVGASGMGAYHGETSIRSFSHARSVLHKPLRTDTLRALYPPVSVLRGWLARRYR